MKTPIYDFVRSYADSSFSRLHMPGHKGAAMLGCEPYDITEIKGADVLGSPSGIIAESQRNAAELFGTAATFYSTEGSSLSVKAMLYTAMVNRADAKAKPVIFAARNSHKSFIYGCALLDIDVVWLYSKDGSLCSCSITPEELRTALDKAENRPFAVYITTPDYLGNIADTAGLAKVCSEYGIPLLVDGAHGAYTAFLDENTHPIKLGAAMCCDSAHKTLPVITPGAYLHLSENLPEVYSQTAETAMQIFATTSPSYLILQSLDLCNSYLDGDFSSELKDCAAKVENLKIKLSELGWRNISSEPIKLTVDCSGYGVSGYRMANILRENGVECEFSDPDYVTLMFSAKNAETDYERVYRAFSCVKPTKVKHTVRTAPPVCEKVMSVREAVMSPFEVVKTEDSVGRICAAPTVSCPPAIPIAVSGERISAECADIFRLYCIDNIAVVKNL